MAMRPRPDIFVEFKLIKGKANRVSVSISVRDQMSNKLLFAKMATSVPYSAKVPGEKNKALSEAVEQAMPAIVEYLKGYTQDIAKNGGWYRIKIENAPAGLGKKVQARLNEMCSKAEEDNANLIVTAQCKQDIIEITTAISKVLDAQAPKAEYEVTEMNAKKITFKLKK